MPLPQHTRTNAGNFRVARADELAGNLAKDYPEFRLVRSDTKLGTLRSRFNETSINGVREALRSLIKE